MVKNSNLVIGSTNYPKHAILLRHAEPYEAIDMYRQNVSLVLNISLIRKPISKVSIVDLMARRDRIPVWNNVNNKNDIDVL